MDLDALTALSLASGFVGIPYTDPRRKELIEKLPALTEDDLNSLGHKDSCCPICFTPYLAVLASEEMALAMESPALSEGDLGVTRLADTCGHLFCRKDITTWIQQNDTCPTCRQPFIPEATTPSDPATLRQSDGRSSAFYALRHPEILANGERHEELERFVLMMAQHPGRVASQQEHGSRERDANEDRETYIGLYS